MVNPPLGNLFYQRYRRLIYTSSYQRSACWQVLSTLSWKIKMSTNCPNFEATILSIYIPKCILFFNILLYTYHLLFNGSPFYGVFPQFRKKILNIWIVANIRRYKKFPPHLNSPIQPLQLRSIKFYILPQQQNSKQKKFYMKYFLDGGIILQYANTMQDILPPWILSWLFP